MEKIKTPTGDTVYSKRLPNGLSCFVFPRKQFLRTYGMLSTNYGSIDLRFGVSGGDCVDVPAGIAHFLEHKLFEEEGGSVFSRYGMGRICQCLYQLYPNELSLFYHRELGGLPAAFD